MKVMGGIGYIDPHRKNYFQKCPALEPESWNKIMNMQPIPEDPIIVSMYSLFIILW